MTSGTQCLVLSVGSTVSGLDEFPSRDRSSQCTQYEHAMRRHDLGHRVLLVSRQYGILGWSAVVQEDFHLFSFSSFAPSRLATLFFVFRVFFFLLRGFSVICRCSAG